MNYVPLGGDEETRVIFEGTIPEHLNELDGTGQRDLLAKLHDIATAEAPPDSFVYETIENLDIIKFSEAGRIYAKVVTGIPEGNTHYHVVYVLYVDADHEYDRGDLVEYSAAAQARLDRATSLTDLDDVEQYLDDHDSLDADDLADLLGR